MKLPFHPISCAGWLVIASSTLASAASAPVSEVTRQIQAHLDRTLLGQEQSWTEAGKFCDERVPRMPEVKTAAEWNSVANTLRRDVLDQVVFRDAQSKRWRDAKTQMVWHETLPGGPGYRIRKVRYEALPGMWIPALLYEPENRSGKTPVHLAVNGHEPEGKSVEYKQLRCINLAKRGILSLNIEWFAYGQLRTSLAMEGTRAQRYAADRFKHAAMNQLDLCGVNGLAPFYLLMSRALDVLLALPNVDPERVAVSGLSGGGWQTIFISSLDPRVKLCNPVAGYSSYRTRAFFRSDLGDSEQTPNDLATVADYAHLTAMMAGRAALLTYNVKDECCFAAGHALEPLMQAAAPIFNLLGQPERLRSHVNYDPGTHNFQRDNREAFYRFVSDIFSPGDQAWRNPKEIPSEPELKPGAELNVELPAANLDLNQLARAAMQGLPRDPDFAQRNPAAARSKLREIVHYRESAAEAKRIASDNRPDFATGFWQVRVGRDWTLPVTEFTRGTPKGATIVLADAGRRSLAGEVERLLNAGQRVLAVDLFGFGESAIAQRGPLYAMTITMAAVGERPLGVHSGQLAALVRWAAAEFKSERPAIAAFGVRTSFIALVTAALEKTTGRLDPSQAMDSLRELIEKNVGADDRPEQFCFGLLEAFDIPQLKALAN